MKRRLVLSLFVATLMVAGSGVAQLMDSPDAGEIAASTKLPVQGESFTLTAPATPEGGTAPAWYHNGDLIPTATTNVYTFTLGDDDASGGVYTCIYDDGGDDRSLKTSYWVVTVVDTPATVPATSLVGLGLLAGAGLVGGVLRSRKK